MLKKIISGGQTGADQAGLEAAAKHGYLTGGWMPRGFRTLDGPRPDLAQRYGLLETPATSYRTRTRLNVRESDATLRLAGKWDSAGERCTYRACKDYGRPCLGVPVFPDLVPISNHEAVAHWIHERPEISILNIAGNSERTLPGIHKYVLNYLDRVFTLLKELGA